jgi:hypothetical protein
MMWTRRLDRGLNRNWPNEIGIVLGINVEAKWM